MDHSTKFVIIHPSGDLGVIKVLNLDDVVKYRINDWCIAITQRFDSAESACKHARALAKKYDFDYIKFDNRYGDDYDDSDPGDSDYGH